MEIIYEYYLNYPSRFDLKLFNEEFGLFIEARISGNKLFILALPETNLTPSFCIRLGIYIATLIK